MALERLGKVPLIYPVAQKVSSLLSQPEQLRNINTLLVIKLFNDVAKEWGFRDCIDYFKSPITKQ